jgi:general secretion pathway protein L
MNLTISDLRTHLTTAYNWWLGGWQDAWAMLPKPAAMQAHADVFQTPQGEFLSYITPPGQRAAWQSVSRTDTLHGLLIDDDHLLLRELALPSLSERDLAAAVAMDVQIASPFPAADTRYGYRTQRLPNGHLRIEIAITHRSQLEPRQSAQHRLTLFARGQHGAISLQGGTQGSERTGLRSPLTLGLLALLTLVLIAWIISPTLLLRAESMLNEAALAQLSARTAPLLQKREELSILQQQLVNAQAYDKEHPDPLLVLDQLTRQIPDGTWLTQFNLRKDQLTLDGVSDNAVAIVSRLEKIPDLKETRLGSSINRVALTGGETFQIIARIQTDANGTNGTTP